MSFTRIRAWRARRKDRKNEQLIAQASVSPKENADARRVVDDYNIIGSGAGGTQPPYGEEGKTHY